MCVLHSEGLPSRPHKNFLEEFFLSDVDTAHSDCLESQIRVISRRDKNLGWAMRREYRKFVPAVAFATLVLGQLALGQTAAEAGFLLSGHDAASSTQDLAVAVHVDAAWFSSLQDGAGPAESDADASESPPVETGRKNIALIGAARPVSPGGMQAPATGATADSSPIGAVITPIIINGPQLSMWVMVREGRQAPRWCGSTILRPPRHS